MAQRIQQMPAMPYAQEALPYSSTARGLGAMTLPNAGKVNQMDGGKMASFLNPQTDMNGLYSMQNVQQNQIARQPQMMASAQRNAEVAMTSESNQTARSQQFMNQKLAGIIEQSPTGGSGIMRFNDMLTGPESATRMNDLAVNRAMNQPGMAPELGQMMQEANRYA